MEDRRELARLRKKFGIPRRTVAELAQISEQSVVRFENNLTKPHVHIARRLKLITGLLRKKEEKGK